MEIVGYPNYLIYEDGRVWSKKSNIFMKLHTTKLGYKRIGLWSNSNQDLIYAHRLVAEAFLPNDDNKKYVDHIDRDKNNNHVSNLRWVTHLENMNNKGEYKTNTSGHKYISRYNNSWRFQKTFNGIKDSKYFKTLDEAIEYKITYKFDLRI
tara:strand:- start:67 stop:519 length:453 start_codon:yes stop_codon:yes gene_type:complete